MGIVTDLVSPRIFCLTTCFFTPTKLLGALLHPLGHVCCRYFTVVLSYFSMAIILSWIAMSLLRGCSLL